MAIVETRISVWEALAGRAPGQPLGPADPGLWTAVAERVNPAKARPTLRPGIETSELVSARGAAYAMLRSPDGRQPCYLRLTPDEVELTHLMDGSRTLARLVADFARISGRLAPDQVRRVVADLAGNRMLEELPLDAFAPLQRVHRRPWPIRLGRGLLAFAQGRRMILANVDPLVTFLYRAGGRLLFTRAVGVLMGTIAAVGLIAFGWQWWAGEQSVFLTKDSYVSGAAVLLGLNILALACHELGHALATKHAGRRVPSAGFLVYFGIPSVFVDTTDVWMAGRRARLLTTAAGPGAGLVLAGAAALVGFAVPEAAPWCFKLSFAWYINAMFNLNPFLALDGYYVVMDWLEVPNLRARGLSWVAARLRRKPPRWSALDREGRLIALYGLLAIGWLVIALNIAYRVYVDRVGGLITGLWRSGWPARVLLVAVVAALLSPVVYILFGWLAKRWRRLVALFGERRVERDTPRRLDALRASSLRDLPADLLAGLAATSRWVYPRTGQQLVFAGAAQPEVFAVVEGALEARAQGDPGGTVRERVGAGGVVGVGAALVGSPSPLAWYAAGTKLLAVPSTAVAAAIGPIGGGVGGSFGTAAEAEALFAETPAMSGLSYEDILGLASVAAPIALAPGAAITLSSPDEALLLASGVIVTPAGEELARGTLIGPAGEEYAGPVAVARTSVRLFSLPAVSGLPLLLGTPVGVLSDQRGRAPGVPPVSGVHPQQAYAPLAIPPAPPPPDLDDSADGIFERKLRWFLVLVVLLALLLTGGNVLLAPLAWAEMPSDKALLRVERGTATAVVGDVSYDLGEDDQIYVGESDDVKVDPRSRALMTYRGGATSVLCAGTDLSMGPLSSAGHPVSPSAAGDLTFGLMVISTHSTSAAFDDLGLTVGIEDANVTNQGTAFYAVAPQGVQVSFGDVFEGGVKVTPVKGPLGCGDGTIIEPPAGTPTPEPTPTDSPSPTPSETPSATPSETAVVPGNPGNPGNPPKTTTKPPTTTTNPPPTTTTTQPPPNQPPSVTFVSAKPTDIAQDSKDPPCRITGPLYSSIDATATDDNGVVDMWATYKIDVDGTAGDVFGSFQGGHYSGRLGPIAYASSHAGGGKITVTVFAKDAAGRTGSDTGVVGLLACQTQIGVS